MFNFHNLVARRALFCNSALHGFRNVQALPGVHCSMQRRYLHLHEYQSKALLQKFKCPVQEGDVADSPDRVFEIAHALKRRGANDLILKCQVLAGGRGKGRLTSGLQGGVKICKYPEQARALAQQMLGYRLITHQSGSEGEPVNKVLVLRGVDIAKEFYLAIILDTCSGGPVIVSSRNGGVDIEDVAKDTPESVVTTPLSSLDKISDDEARQVAATLGYSNVAEVKSLLNKLYNLFKETDATIVEINPLAVISTIKKRLMCVDAKLNFDDNAGYRQPEITAMDDKSHINPQELEAQQAGLSYVAMHGNIGCLVNGAGLAMATMDIIKLHGGEPANFLDVGGGATVSQVCKAFEIIKGDAKVKAIFVNIFGGIMRCDIIAEGLLRAAQQLELQLPLVIRLVGNHVGEAKQLLAREKGSVRCEVVDDLASAAARVCSISRA